VRLEIYADGYNYSIDTIEPDTLGKWVVEIFDRIGPMDASSYLQVRAWPSFSTRANQGGDWILNSSMNNPLFGIKSPREMVEGLSKALDEAGL